MKIWWCLEHNSERYPVERKGRCWHVIVASNFKIDAPCRMVPMRLIPDNAETVERIANTLVVYDKLPAVDRAIAILAALDGEYTESVNNASTDGETP